MGLLQGFMPERPTCHALKTRARMLLKRRATHLP